MSRPETFRVLDGGGNLITGGVTEEDATLADVAEAIGRLKKYPMLKSTSTGGGWTIERE